MPDRRPVMTKCYFVQQRLAEGCEPDIRHVRRIADELTETLARNPSAPVSAAGMLDKLFEAYEWHPEFPKSMRCK